jgi:hypothetical protein
MRNVGLATLMVAVALTSRSYAGGADGPALSDLLAKAGQYVGRYDRDFDQVAAEEEWTQKLFQHRNQRVLKIRKLQSDLTFMHPGGDLRWIEYRDVWNVDGKPVHERDDRLGKLFGTLRSDSYVKAQKIAEESATYNVRSLGSFDTPTLALVFLHPDNQSRFKWKRKGKSTVGGVSAWALDFEETGKPTFIGDGAGNDFVSKGTVWIGEADGALLKSEARIKDATGQLEVDVTVEFGPWQAAGVLVPTALNQMFLTSPSLASSQALGMREGGGAIGMTEGAEYVETMAVYSNYRSLQRKAEAVPAKESKN